ncbi:MAG: histone deacetylase [Planctomycetota bacterium]
MLPVVFDPAYELDWPGHVFPAEKYELVAEQLVREGIVGPGGFHVPEPMGREGVLRVHEASYLDALDAIAAGDAPWDPRFEVPVNRSVVDAFYLACGGTSLAAGLALEHRWALSVGGGFHHAYPDHGEGFCLLNDVAVAARRLVDDGVVGRILVVDADVHQGNGTAFIFRDQPLVFTFSIHQEDLYPIKEQSDLDVGVWGGTGDEEYLSRLDAALRQISGRFQPEIVFYLAGADPFERDQLAQLRLTREGLRRRDALVLDAAESWGAPLVGLLAGGYSIDVADVVGIHVDLARALDDR